MRFQDDLRRPGDVSGKDRRGDQRIRTQQDAEGAQREAPVLAPAREGARRVRRRRKRSTAASSQLVANSTSRQMIPTKTKAGGVSASSGSNSASRRRAARQRECQQAKAEPVRGRDQQEHAARAGRDRVDHAPQHGHDRGLPVAEHTLGDVLVDEFRVVGHDAGIKDQQRQAVACGYQRGDGHVQAVAAPAACGQPRAA